MIDNCLVKERAKAIEFITKKYDNYKLMLQSIADIYDDNMLKFKKVCNIYDINGSNFRYHGQMLDIIEFLKNKFQEHANLFVISGSSAASFLFWFFHNEEYKSNDVDIYLQYDQWYKRSVLLEYQQRKEIVKKGKKYLENFTKRDFDLKSLSDVYYMFDYMLFNFDNTIKNMSANYDLYEFNIGNIDCDLILNRIPSHEIIRDFCEFSSMCYIEVKTGNIYATVGALKSIKNKVFAPTMKKWDRKSAISKFIRLLRLSTKTNWHKSINEYKNILLYAIENLPRTNKRIFDIYIPYFKLEEYGIVDIASKFLDIKRKYYYLGKEFNWDTEKDAVAFVKKEGYNIDLR